MYKYIFFVFLGILIYLYYNQNDNFSVGGQITQSIEQLESMKRGLKKCERNRLNRLERATV